MRHIWSWEIKRRRTSTLWWSVGVLLLVGFTVLSYASIKNQAAELEEAFASFSSNASSFVGTSDMFSPAGYLNSQLYFITLPILYIILALALSSSLLGKEEDDHTLELLLARPVSRSRVLAGKALAGLTIIGIAGIVATITSIVSVQIVGIDISYSGLLLANVAAILFSASFGAISFALLAASLASRRLAMVLAIVISFGGYIITSMAGLIDWLEWPAKFMPYHYYDPGSLLEGAVGSGLGLYLIGTFVLTAIIATLGFRHRDIE